MTGFTHVIAARHVDPGAARLTLDLPEGMTLQDIVSAALPGALPAEIAACRVALVTDRGSEIIAPDLWPRIRPRPGVQVVIRVVADGDGLRSILSIVVTIAAIASGQLWGAQFGAALGLGAKVATAVGTALIGVGVSVIGLLLINALIPPPKPSKRDAENRYNISGWRNPVDPNGAVPEIMGQIRVAPPFAALSHTEIVGDLQYVRALFCLGYGPLEITDLRIGETSLADFDEVEVELRQGLPGDLPVSLYPRQIAEESIGLELVRPLPRDDLGEVIEDAPGEETPVVRTTGADASAASVILAFPAGLVRFSKEGKSRPETVSVRIEQRLVTAEEWALVTTLEITAKKLEAFYRQHTWSFPTRGRWQVRLTMLTDENTSAQTQRRTSWAALQTIRPEYPLNFSQPLALAALRVKATYQLSGSLDSFNALVRRVCLDWDHVTETWISRATSNPASLFRLALQSPANPRPVTDAGIDLEALADWHDFCRTRGLTYDRELTSTDSTLRDVLAEIAAAGRAAPRHDGLRWGVVIDRPDLPVVDHVSPRNSWAFRSGRSYLQHPDAFRVPFLDATNDYKPAERLVPRPGFTGVPVLTEELPMPGKTDPAEVYREALRRWYEVLLRPDTYEVTQDGPVRVATRGDHIALSHDVLDRVQCAARVRRVVGTLIELDEPVTMVEGAAYGIRFRVFADAEDTIGASVVRTVETAPGEQPVLVVTGAGDMPQDGDLILFGPAGQESFRLMVTGVEAAEGMTSILRAVDVAPEIDTLVDAAEIPTWSGRVGAEVPEATTTPPMPRFLRISSGVSGTDDADAVVYEILPGTGPVGTASYRIDHRLSGAGSWTAITIPAANGGGRIAGYAAGDAIEMRAVALSFAGIASAVTPVIALVVGAGDAPIPAALDSEAVTVTALLGGARVDVAVASDPATAQLQLYRSTSAVLDRATDAVGNPVAVSPGSSHVWTLGDGTRTNLVAGGGMADPGAWTLGAGWSISGGVASHAAGSQGWISQAETLTSGRWYRMSGTISARTAGTLTPCLLGGTARYGTGLTANGAWRDRIQAVTGNDTFSIRASADCVAALDDVVAYLETGACLSQGTHYIWVEPQNADGVPGPVTGPITVTIA